MTAGVNLTLLPGQGEGNGRKAFPTCRCCDACEDRGGCSVTFDPEAYLLLTNVAMMPMLVPAPDHPARPPRCPHGCRGRLVWVVDQWYCQRCGDEWPENVGEARHHGAGCPLGVVVFA